MADDRLTQQTRDMDPLAVVEQAERDHDDKLVRGSLLGDYTAKEAEQIDKDLIDQGNPPLFEAEREYLKYMNDPSLSANMEGNPSVSMTRLSQGGPLSRGMINAAAEAFTPREELQKKVTETPVLTEDEMSIVIRQRNGLPLDSKEQARYDQLKAKVERLYEGKDHETASSIRLSLQAQINRQDTEATRLATNMHAVLDGKLEEVDNAHITKIFEVLNGRNSNDIELATSLYVKNYPRTEADEETLNALIASVGEKEASYAFLKSKLDTIGEAYDGPLPYEKLSKLASGTDGRNLGKDIADRLQQLVDDKETNRLIGKGLGALGGGALALETWAWRNRKVPKDSSSYLGPKLGAAAKSTADVMKHPIHSAKQGAIGAYNVGKAEISGAVKATKETFARVADGRFKQGAERAGASVVSTTNRVKNKVGPHLESGTAVGIGAVFGLAVGGSTADESVRWWGKKDVQSLQLLTAGLSKEQLDGISKKAQGERLRDTVSDDLVLKEGDDVTDFVDKFDLKDNEPLMVKTRPDQVTDKWIESAADVVVQHANPQIDATTGQVIPENDQVLAERQRDLQVALSQTLGVLGAQDSVNGQKASELLIDRVNSKLAAPPFTQKDPRLLAAATTEEEKKNVPMVLKPGLHESCAQAIASTLGYSEAQSETYLNTLKEGFDAKSQGRLLYSVLKGNEAFTSKKSLSELSPEEREEIGQAYNQILRPYATSQQSEIIAEYNKLLGTEQDIQELVDELPATIHNEFILRFNADYRHSLENAELVEYVRFNKTQMLSRYENDETGTPDVVGDDFLRESRAGLYSNEDPASYRTYLKGLSNEAFVAQHLLHKGLYQNDMGIYRERFGERDTNFIIRGYQQGINPWLAGANAVAAYNAADTVEEGVRAAKKKLADAGITPGTEAFRLSREVAFSVYGNQIRPLFD